MSVAPPERGKEALTRLAMLQHRRLAPVQPNRGSGVRAVAGDGRDCAATAYQRLAHVAADEATASKYNNLTRCRRGAEGYQRKHARDFARRALVRAARLVGGRSLLVSSVLFP